MRRAIVGIVVTVLSLLALPFAAPQAGAAAADPVIIVAGTFSPSLANEPLAARLRADGYRVWIFQLPSLGTGDIAASARSLNTFADSVRSQTGAAKVDLIGHSQGGLVLDGHVVLPLEEGSVFEVSRAPVDFLLMTSVTRSYYALLRSKLGWGEVPKWQEQP